MKCARINHRVLSRVADGPFAAHLGAFAESQAALGYAKRCPSLTDKRVTVHRLRHTAAMDLLQAGVDRSVIALWLGHESVETTQIYLEATMTMKEQALAKVSPLHGRRARFRPSDQLLGFLNSL